MSGSLGDADRYRIRQLADFVRTRDTASLLTWLAPGLSPVERVAVAQNCTFTHAGLLVFPADDGSCRRRTARPRAHARAAGA